MDGVSGEVSVMSADSNGISDHGIDRMIYLVIVKVVQP